MEKLRSVAKRAIQLESLSAMLIRHEGLKLKAYKCPAGKTTIGVGRNLDDVGITSREAISLLSNDIIRVTEELKTKFIWFKYLSDNRQMAMIDMCFNLGITRFSKFKKMIKALEEEDYASVTREMLDSEWANQVGNRSVELANIMWEG